MYEPSSRKTARVERVLICGGQRHELPDGDCVTFDADCRPCCPCVVYHT